MLAVLLCCVQVLSNPMHNWDHVPEAFCRQLRQPLCMALLRNCATPDSAAYGLALKLLMAILNLLRYAGCVWQCVMCVMSKHVRYVWASQQASVTQACVPVSVCVCACMLGPTNTALSSLNSLCS